MSVYAETYESTYPGGYPVSFLDVQADIYLGATLGWTSITQWLYLRDPTTIRRGRPDESSSAQPSQASLTLDNRTNRFTVRNPTGPWYGLLRQNTPLRLSVPAYTAGLPNCLRFADDTASYASTPDAAGLDITGDIELQLDLWPDSWMPCVLASKDDADTQRSWSWRLNGSGLLEFHWFDSGSGGHIATSTAPMPPGRISLRVTLAVASGTVTFYTSATPVDASPSWTQLGDTTVAGATSVFDSTTAVAVGANAAITALDAAGQVTTIGPLGMIFGFVVLDGIGGTAEASPDFTIQTAGTASFADGQGNTWTLNGTSEISDRLYRFHGELGNMPKAADPSGRDVYSQATADGVLRRLQQGSSPADSVMVRSVTSYPSAPSAAVTATSPQSTIAFWSCEDGQGSTSFASSIAVNADGITPQPMQFSGVPSIQAQTGSPQADSVFACSGQLPQVQQSRWTAAVPPYSTSGPGAFTLLFLLTIPAAGIGADADLLDLFFFDGATGYTLSLEYATGSNGSLTLNVEGT
ncbi:MAG TPA: hypothetical protein VHZ33_02225, partial [Trebonia sp.]|nr:hypothetical protein [Trebonia sp.]